MAPAPSTPELLIRDFTPDELPAAVCDLLYNGLYRDFGVAPDQDWLHSDEVGRFYVATSTTGTLCGVGRLMPLAPEFPDRGPQIRQLITAPAMRGRGVGTAVLETLENTAVAQGAAGVWLKARIMAWGFYEKRGYRFEGAGFSCGEHMDEDGLFISQLTGIPHRVMTKRLQSGL